MHHRQDLEMRLYEQTLQAITRGKRIWVKRGRMTREQELQPHTRDFKRYWNMGVMRSKFTPSLYKEHMALWMP